MIQDLKNRGYSAIGAAGFCWGGKFVDILLCFPLWYLDDILANSTITCEQIQSRAVTDFVSSNHISSCYLR